MPEQIRVQDILNQYQANAPRHAAPRHRALDDEDVYEQQRAAQRRDAQRAEQLQREEQARREQERREREEQARREQERREREEQARREQERRESEEQARRDSFEFDDLGLDDLGGSIKQPKPVMTHRQALYETIDEYFIERLGPAITQSITSNIDALRDELRDGASPGRDDQAITAAVEDVIARYVAESPATEEAHVLRDVVNQEIDGFIYNDLLNPQGETFQDLYPLLQDRPAEVSTPPMIWYSLGLCGPLGATAMMMHQRAQEIADPQEREQAQGKASVVAGVGIGVGVVFWIVLLIAIVKPELFDPLLSMLGLGNG